MVKHNDIVEMISENNIPLYILLTIAIIALILLYLYFRCVSFKPLMMLCAKLKRRKNLNQNTPQQIEIEETPFPILFSNPSPSIGFSLREGE